MQTTIKRILVTGGSKGLGAAIVEELSRAGNEVIDYSPDSGYDVRDPERIEGQLDVLINNAGVNEISWLPDLKLDTWQHIMDVNTASIWRMTQLHLDQLRASRGTVLNIVSNAAHMPMRCSAAYNASKGAALILTKQLARELAPDVTVFSVSPNRLAGTGMSEYIDERVIETRGWTREEARKYQLSSLLAGAETPPQRVAEFIAFLLADKERHRYLTGCDLPYGV
jgi:NAD(P)-dependent dehydrogenase (short-subunit alcohol dehydrogenase family)